MNWIGWNMNSVHETSVAKKTKHLWTMKNNITQSNDWPLTEWKERQREKQRAQVFGLKYLSIRLWLWSSIFSIPDNTNIGHYLAKPNQNWESNAHQGLYTKYIV